MATHGPIYKPLNPDGEPLEGSPQAEQDETEPQQDRFNELLERAYNFLEPLARPLGPVTKVLRLLTSGYSSERSQRRLEKQADWSRFRTVLMIKLQNIGVVSGLLLAANTNLICMGPTRRMTYVACLASIYMSLMSIIFGLLCLWSIAGVHPSRLRELSKQTMLFYYLNSTPSLFGGCSALAFFVAVGAWVWLEADQGTTAKILVVLLGTALMGNAGACFVLGAKDWHSEPTEN